MKKYTADFETATWLENETYVWAWATCEIGNPENIVIGNSIETFIEWCIKNDNTTLYFHNLKFDGEFIINYLLQNDFKWIEERKDYSDNTFTTVISDLGQFYNIEVVFKKYNGKYLKTEFYDSLKIIPFAVEDIAKSFNLPISKLEIDYLKPRKRGHKLTPDEIEYIKNDVTIVALALNQLFDKGLTKMTAASNALSDYKKILGAARFKHFFPELSSEVDKDIRQSYKGGFTYCNPIYKEKDVGYGITLDVNSLYPYILYSKPMPFSDPVFFKGKYQEDKTYPLYIQRITCSFKLKANKIPTIQIKHSKYYFVGNEYLRSSNGLVVSLTLTNIDLKLFLEQYDVDDLTYESGWKFKAITGLFSKYIDKWVAEKNQGTISGNKGQRTRAKLMLNSLYGKFAKSITMKSQMPFIGVDEIVHYETLPEKEAKGLYLPVAIFTTSYAREKTIRTSQAITDYSIKKYGKDLYCYSDTDSISCLLPIEELKQFCEIDDVELGKWKHESTFTKARFVRQKCYIKEIDGKMEITCSGMPKSCYKYVTWEKFKTGLSVPRETCF